MAPGSKTNAAVRDALLKKLKVTPQALSERRKRLNRLVAMPVDIATYVIAHREGIQLNRYLDGDTLARVNEADARLRAAEGSAPAAARAPKALKGPARATKIVQLGNAALPAAALSSVHTTEAERMAEVYPLLYVFENSAREFIDGHLAAKYGAKWDADPRIVNKSIRQKVERNRKAEDRNRYHSRRNARFVFYTDLGDLADLVRSEHGIKVFKPLFPRDTWFPELVNHFEVSRNIVAHMNPIPKEDVRRLAGFLKDWLNQTKDHQP